jgi:hypothetical protein
MRLKSAEYRQEKGQNKCAVAGWVGGFPCRGQEAPQCALQAVSPTPGAMSTTLPKALKDDNPEPAGLRRNTGSYPFRSRTLGRWPLRRARAIEQEDLRLDLYY